MKKIIRGLIVFLVIMLILLIGAGALLRFDVFGLGTRIVGPYLVDVPVINLVLPEMPVPEEEETDGYVFETVEEAVEILKLTEKMLKESDEKADELSEQLTQLTAEVNRLKVFENNQLQFEADKGAFDRLVATSAEDIVYKDWFEKMYPDNAAEIYAEVAMDVALSEEMKELVSIYQNMKADNAASILETMATTKLDQVATIISSVSSDQAAKILGAMAPATAARITTYLSPEQ